MDRVRSFDRVRARELEDAKRGIGLAVEFAVHAVIASGELDAGDVADMSDLAVVAGFDHDVAKLVFINEPALGIDSELEGHATLDRRLADHAGGNLNVLLANRVNDVIGCESPRGDLFRIKPDAHAVIARAENGDVADAGQTS